MIVSVTEGRDVDNVLRCYKVKREDGSVWFVPIDEANSDYQAYLAWVAEGNTPEVVEL